MRLNQPLFFFLLICGLASTLAADARAQAAPEASTSAAATERARKLFVEAARLYDEGQYAQAYVAFAAAWAIKKHPSIAGNLADCEMKVGKYRDAAEHLRYIAKDTSGEAKAEDKRRAQERLDEVSKRLGVLAVTVIPNGSEVTLDGAPLGKSPLVDTVFVDPGQHSLEAHGEGYLPGKVAFEMGAGSMRPVRLSLSLRGSASVPLPERRSVIPGAVLGGVAGAALATGIGLLVVGGNKLSTSQSVFQQIMQAHQGCIAGAHNLDARCSTLKSTASTSDAFDRAGIGLLIGAGATAVGSVVYFVWPASKSGAPAAGGVRVVPALSMAGGGILASGTF